MKHANADTKILSTIFLLSLAITLLLISLVLFTPADPHAKKTELILTQDSSQPTQNTTNYSDLSKQSQSQFRNALGKLSNQDTEKVTLSNPTTQLQHTDYITLDNTIYNINITQTYTNAAMIFMLFLLLSSAIASFSGLLLFTVAIFFALTKLTQTLKQKLNKNRQTHLEKIYQSTVFDILIITLFFLIVILIFLAIVSFGTITTVQKVNPSQTQNADIVPATELSSTDKNTFYELIAQDRKVWGQLEDYTYIKSDGEIYKITRKSLTPYSITSTAEFKNIAFFIINTWSLFLGVSFVIFLFSQFFLQLTYYYRKTS